MAIPTSVETSDGLEFEPLLSGKSNKDRLPNPTQRIVCDDTVDFGTTGSSNTNHSHHSGSNHSPSSLSRYGAYHSPQSSFSVASYSQGPSEPIDNTTLVYIPITLPCGNQIMCAPDVLSNSPMVLRSLQADLTQIYRLLPWSVHALVKRTKIWVNASYSYGPKDDPFVLRHSTAHHGEGWLMEVAHDVPDKALGVEIYSCFDFERMRLHWNGCGLLLHEFCHLIHQACLGLDHPVVQHLFDQASRSGNYEKVLRRDWASKKDETDLAYAMVDVKEFFAEISVAYLCKGYRDLDDADSHVMELCSPPLLEPRTLQRVLGDYGIRTCQDAYVSFSSSSSSSSKRVDHDADEDECFLFFASLLRKNSSGTFFKRKKPKIRMAHPLWQESTVARSCRDAQPCNKFYPFTNGQLRKHDPQLWKALDDLWRHEIGGFSDPILEDQDACWSLKKYLPRFDR